MEEKILHTLFLEFKLEHKSSILEVCGHNSKTDTTAKQAKKRRASPPEYDIGSGLGINVQWGLRE